MGASTALDFLRIAAGEKKKTSRRFRVQSPAVDPGVNPYMMPRSVNANTARMFAENRMRSCSMAASLLSERRTVSSTETVRCSPALHHPANRGNAYEIRKVSVILTRH